MSRVNFDIRVLDHRDPITGIPKCRYCSSPIPKGRKKYYCSDSCRDHVYSNFGWGATRYQVWKRDKGKCVVCGRPVRYIDLSHDQIYLRTKYDKDTEFQEFECHHIIPVDFLYPFVFELVREWFPRWEIHDSRWQRKFNITWIIVYTDMNNLITLCEEHHNRVHETEYYFDEKLSDAQNIMIRDLWANAKINPWRTKQTLDQTIVQNKPENTLLKYIAEKENEEKQLPYNMR